jgi:hypothetical protein
MAWGLSASPTTARPSPGAQTAPLEVQISRQDYDQHLRSAKHVTGYHVEADDGQIGHVDDFLLDPQTWALRYFIIDTRNWLPGRHVLLATDWIDQVSWAKRVVRVPLCIDAIRNSPEWRGQGALGEAEERLLHDHYGNTLDAGQRGGQLR